MKFYSYFIGVILCCSFLKSSAQNNLMVTSDNLNFKNYSTTDGLSQRSVVAIVQDAEGYLWFGTRYGLNKFDGHSFKNYYYDSTNEHSLSDSWITSLAIDAKGNIWIGTKNGLNKYNPYEDNFERVQVGLDNKDYLYGEIWDIHIDNTRLWIATNRGLWNLNTATNEVIRYKHKTNSPSSPSSNKLLSLIKSGDGDLWVCTETHVDKYNSDTDIFSHYNYPNEQSPLRAKNNNVVLFEDTVGNLWLGYDGGLALFDVKTNAFVDYALPNGNKAIHGNVRTIYEDEDQNLWIGTYQGLFLLNSKTKNLHNYQHNVTISNSLSQNSVYDIVADSRGDIWIGTWAGGINYLDKGSNAFTSFGVGADNNDLNYKVVSSIVQDNNKNLWVGTEGGGLNFYDETSNTFTYYTQDPENDNSLVDNNVKAVIKDHLGNLWVGTHNKGLDYVSLGKGVPTFTHIGNAENPSGLSSNRITSLLEDNNNNIWIGTNNGGLNLYDTKKKTFLHIPDHKDALGSFIYSISKTSDNSILVGGINGLAKIDIATNKIKKIPFKPEEGTTYSIQKVISTYEDPQGNIWVGTEGNGLFFYDNKKKESKRYGVQEGLPDEVIYTIVPDSEHNLWLSTNKGLSKMNLTSHTFKNYNLSDGIQGNEFNYGAFLKKNDGRIIFGGVDGFTIFDPQAIKEDSFMPPLVIQSVNIRNKGLKNFGKGTSKIRLEHDQNDITFDYVALGYSQPNKNLYAYKLDGFDSDWNYVGTNRTATYTNLFDGDYTFKVKATNSDGVWNETSTSVIISIAPPLWQTWWAYLIYLLLISMLFIFVRKYSILRIREKAELEQERLAREREEEVNRLKLQLFTNISHDFRTPLTLIIGPLKRMINEKSGGHAIQERLQGMYRNASILLQLINQLLDFRKSESGKIKLSAKKLDMVPFLQNIKLSFEELAKEREIDYRLTTESDSIDVWFDKIEMKKVVLNVLSNAFKFTSKGGNIILKASTIESENEGGGFFKLVIEDNGRGIRKEDIEFIFDRYFQLGQRHELRSGTGVGLALAKDIVTLHNGEISVDSSLEKGTRFTIVLPLGHAHFGPQEISPATEDDTDETMLLNSYDPTQINIGWINKESAGEEIDNYSHPLNKNLDTLLLVEDNLEVRGFIKELFKNKYNLLEAPNGIHGINIAHNNPIDLIISDVMMPEMDGIEFCKRIKADIKTSHIQVILLTARTSTKIQKIGYNTGADAYITKPFDSDLLILQVANLLKSRQKLTEKFRKEFILEPKRMVLESPDEIFLNKAIEIIEEYVSESNFNASTLVEKMHMSQSVLYRKLKTLTGQSISEFIRTIKLKKAAQLLLNTDLNIANIAYEVGFNDIKYFRTCFKKVFGCTATQYRKEKVSEVDEVE